MPGRLKRKHHLESIHPSVWKAPFGNFRSLFQFGFTAARKGTELKNKLILSHCISYHLIFGHSKVRTLPKMDRSGTSAKPFSNTFQTGFKLINLRRGGTKASACFLTRVNCYIFVHQFPRRFLFFHVVFADHWFFHRFRSLTLSWFSLYV